MAPWMQWLEGAQQHLQQAAESDVPAADKIEKLLKMEPVFDLGTTDCSVVPTGSWILVPVFNRPC
jgi:hypothetical protein